MLPISSMYSTPSVLTASSLTLPEVFWYSAAAMLVGTEAISKPPVAGASCVLISSGEVATEKL